MGRSSSRTTILLILLTIVTGLLITSERLLGLRHSALVSASTISFRAEVVSDPIRGKSKVIGSHMTSSATTFKANLYWAKIEGRNYSLHLPVRVSTHRRIALIPGSRISGSGIVFATSERGVAALISLRGELHQISKGDLMNRITGEIRSSFRGIALTVGGESGALLPGLVLGDTTLEGEKFLNDMRRTGLTHLTAVSGENFAFIATFLLWITQMLIRDIRGRVALTALVLICFIFLVRPSPSVLRASLMTAVLLVGRIKGVRSSPLPALGFAIFILILVDPFQASDPGFALSVCATAGILLLAPLLTQSFAHRVKSKWLIDICVIPLSATLFCTPIIVALSGQISLVSLFANILVCEFVAPITILGLLAALLSPIAPLISHLLLVMCQPFSMWIVFVAHTLSKAPLILLPNGVLGAALIIVLLYFSLRRRWRLLLFLFTLLLLSHLLTNSPWPGRDWVIVNCDVGQGDAAVLNAGNGEAILIDVGPDPKLIDSCLHDLEIKRVPLLVLTHFHADHVSGLPGAISGRQFGQVWVTSLHKPDFEYSQTMRALHGLNISTVFKGERARLMTAGGPISIDVLWPPEQPLNLPSLPGDGSTINNASIALSIHIRGITYFTSGDTEPPAQEALLDGVHIDSASVMKVSHHGSAYQEPALFDRLHPKVAIISVGSGNHYGHPAPSTIAALKQRGISVYRTDLDGAIAIDSHLKISTRKRRWWEISWG